MDANIKAAASSLRKASFNMRNRVRELQSDESHIHSREMKEERNIRSDMFQTGVRLAQTVDDSRAAQYLTKHVLDLRKRSKLIKNEADRTISAEEKEIRALLAQANKLDEIAHMLEMWK